ncbi:MAG: hydantoinase B/oxoprolinase family protein, partial [Planctomycetes bacterium]|nr:hydantoinase B/oxoprolinase family protein [Planctomycetota bacterium]
MTSNGGLVDASNVVGKDTILSGPAGGVVGCAQISRAAGFDRAIGFDMGGTSTDVSRIDLQTGSPAPPHDRPACLQFEYKHETVQAGVRLMTPMLAVETVAAGGGSLCAFDGQMLTVGPHSAGADPGPACYGRGGPLAVTDMNVFLGRIPDACFPFPLERGVVEQELGVLCERINRESGSSHTPISLAEGFIRIANEKMAAAIKRISLAKGYDVREYALTAFGGAGGQHACAVARAMGIKRVLCSPLAGVLSAVGIGVARIKRLGERSVRVALDGAAGDALEAVFVEMTERLKRELADEGIDANQLLDPIRSADLCYKGQATFITVPAGASEPACRFNRLHEEFETKHRRLYGYTHEGRGVEVRAVRVELGARADASPATTCREGILGTADQGTVPRTIDMVVAARRRSVSLYLRSELVPGQQIPGPAVIAEETSTIVIESGWHADVQRSGEVVLTDEQPAPKREEVSTKADPVQLELFNNQFASVARQMGATLRRTSLSTNVKERLDYSCALFTPEGDLVVNAPHIPVHLGGMSDCVKALIEDVGPMSPGDVFITNDPYRGGSHLNDVTVVTPVFHDGGKALSAFVASRAHHAEIGGTRPGSMPPDSRTLAEEGVLIRAFRWMSNGKPQTEALRALLAGGPYPSRAPDENLADVAAQVAANQTGLRDLTAMANRYGAGTVRAFMRHIQAAAERRMRAEIGRLADGVHDFQDALDDGSPIHLRITVTGDEATFDFSGTGPVLAGNLNANRSIVTSAVLYCLRCLIDCDIPLCGGVLAPVRIVLPECLLNPTANEDPAKCPAVVGGNVETSQRVVDCILGALAMTAASQGTMNNLLMGNERFGYYETICGGAGAGPGFDGADAVHTNMTNTRLTDPEVLEARYPVRLVRFEIRSGSGGDGRYRGGNGVIREIEFLEPLEVSILSQRRTTRPFGLRGGSAGSPGRNLLFRAAESDSDGSRGNADGAGDAPAGIDLGPIARVSVRPGDILRIETPGGGGYGTPE